MNGLIKPKVGNGKKATSSRRISIVVDFTAWNVLAGSGEPKEILEQLIRDYVTERIKQGEKYFLSSTRLVHSVSGDTEIPKSPTIEELRNAHASAIAKGQHRKADSLRQRLTVLESIPTVEE